ncbi:hypothetical protein ACTXT7_001504 [Hymenolepis weldensis]
MDGCHFVIPVNKPAWQSRHVCYCSGVAPLTSCLLLVLVLRLTATASKITQTLLERLIEVSLDKINEIVSSAAAATFNVATATDFDDFHKWNLFGSSSQWQSLQESGHELTRRSPLHALPYLFLQRASRPHASHDTVVTATQRTLFRVFFAGIKPISSR